MLDIEKLKESFDSEEGKSFWDRIRIRREIKNSQLERLHKYIKDDQHFAEIVEKLQNKYESNEYVNKCYSRGYMPNTPLYFFLYHYAEKYGKEATTREYKLHGNMFTSGLYKCRGYWFNRMDGQGSIIQISKIKL